MSREQGLLFVISGPSGCGKTTLGRRLLRYLPDLVRSISVTTRQRRKKEKNGREYLFVDESEFNRLRQENKFLEWARVFDCFYGTPRDFVLKNIRRGKDVLLVIDVQGAMQIKKKLPEAIFIFISPPSDTALEERLKKRRLDSPAEVKRRLGEARKEMACRKKYDYEIINDKIETASGLLKSIVEAERCRIRYQRLKGEGRRCRIYP